jgi:outer membrane protein
MPFLFISTTDTSGCDFRVDNRQYRARVWERWPYAIQAIAFLFCMVMTAASAKADGELQGVSTAPLGLAEALDYARSHYASVEAALDEKEAAQKRTDVAKTAYLPQETLLVQINRSTINNITGLLLPQGTLPTLSGPVFPETGSSFFNSGAGVLVTWQPFDFGYRASVVDAARQGERVAEQTLSLTELQVESATGNAYMNLAAAQSLVEVAHANVDRLDTLSKVTHVLATNKLRAGVDAEQADAAEALAKTTLLSALSNVEIQRATLAKLLDRPAKEVAIDTRRILEPPPGNTLAARLIDDHPAAQQEAARVAQQSAQLRVVERSDDPQVDLIGSVSARGSGRDAVTGANLGGLSGIGPDVGNWALGAQVSVPLGIRPTLRAQKAAQQAQLNAERDRYDQVRGDLVEQLSQAKAELKAARQIAAVSPVALRAAVQSEQQQKSRYQYRLATVVDVTTAEAALAQAQSQDAIANLNVWRALADIAAAEGDFSDFLHLLSVPAGPAEKGS